MEEKRNVLYQQKIIRSGRMLEVYTYKTKQVKSLTDDLVKVKSDMFVSIEPEVIENERIEIEPKKDKQRFERTEEYKQRAKKNFRRLIESNAENHEEKDKFLTLTFAKNIQDRAFVLKEFRKFVYKARRKYKHFEYVAVIEAQERGALHFHCFLFGFPFIPKDEIKKLGKLWGHGSIELQAVKDTFKLQNYLTKYFMKTFDVLNYGHERRYFASKGLKRSVVVVMTENVDLNEFGHQLVDYDFESNFVGEVNYQKIRLYTKNSSRPLDEIIKFSGASRN